MSNPTAQTKRRSGAARSVWRFLGSIRLGITLLILIAIASTLGVVLPQPDPAEAGRYIGRRLDPQSPEALKPRELVALARAAGVLPRDDAFPHLLEQAEQVDPQRFEQAWEQFLFGLAQQLQKDEEGEACLRLAYVDSCGKVVGPVLLFLRLHVVFSSAWFRALCLLLIVNLALCSIRRFPWQWEAAFGMRAGKDAGWYLKRSIHAAVSLPSTSDALTEKLGKALREHGIQAKVMSIDGTVEAADAALRAQGFRARRYRETRLATLEGTRGWLGGLGRAWWPLGKLAGLGRLGSQVVHLGVVLVVIGGFVSGLLSFRHAQVIRRGDVVAVPDVSYRLSLRYQLRHLGYRLLRLFGAGTRPEPTAAERAANAEDWREKPGQPPRSALFWLRLRRFDYHTDSRGMAEYYGSHVTLHDTNPLADELEKVGGRLVYRDFLATRRVRDRENDGIPETIEMNRPLVYHGFHAYQQSLERDCRWITSVSFVVAKLAKPGRATGHPSDGEQAEETQSVLEQFTVAVPPHARMTVPGTDLTIEVLDYFPHFQMPFEEGPDGQVTVGKPYSASDKLMNPAVQVRFETPGHPPLERWVFLPFRPDEPRSGSMVDFASYRLAAIDFATDYATWLTFKTHPVMWPVWVGCGVMMLGVLLCFYCNHERIWALARARDDGGCDLFFAGDSFKWRERFKDRFDAVVAALSGEAIVATPNPTQKGSRSAQ
jgi:cytochrome c biogenesis protein ResB